MMQKILIGENLKLCRLIKIQALMKEVFGDFNKMTLILFSRMIIMVKILKSILRNTTMLMLMEVIYFKEELLHFGQHYVKYVKQKYRILCTK
jgi:hypothetical protein